MTSREIVKAAINHQETSRVPYYIDFCEETWQTIEKSSDEISREEYLNNDIKDIVVPWWQWYELGDDWSGTAVPASPDKVMGTGSYSEFINSVKETSDKYLLVRIYGSHFEKANFARGMEKFLADMAAEPDFARKLLNAIIEKNLVMLDNFLSVAEIDGVLLGSDWGSQKGLMMSPSMWEEMIRPGEQREYDLIHAYGKDVWIHSCGDIKDIIPSLIEMGVNVLNPIQPEVMDINKLKDEYGHSLTFWGGISTQRTLPFATPEEVKEEARKTREIMSRKGGYIFAPAQAIQADVPLENIKALLEVARESL